MNPADYWGPRDTYSYVVDENDQIWINGGWGPYLSQIPIIDSMDMQDCDCGYSHEELLNWEYVVAEGYFHDGSIGDYDSSWDVIVRCPNCGKVWRDVQ
jgi:hypothetical protein